MTAFDSHANLAATLVTVAPAPPSSGTTLAVRDISVFPAAPFNATVWPNGEPANGAAEIVRVTGIVGSTLTIVRGQEGTNPLSIASGWQIALTITAKSLTDIEAAVNSGSLPADANALGFGFVGWNYSPWTAAVKTALTSQTAYVMGMYLPAGAIVTGVVLQVAQAGSGTAPTGFFVGLCSPTTMLAQSANLKSSGQLTAGGKAQLPLSAPYTIPTSGIYYVVVLQNGTFGTTALQFDQAAAAVSSLTTPLAGEPPFCGTIGTGLSALPANDAAVTITLTSSATWFAGCY